MTVIQKKKLLSSANYLLFFNGSIYDLLVKRTKALLAVVVVLKIAIQASDQFTSSAQQAAKVHLVLEDDLGKACGSIPAVLPVYQG